jgi:hypothetical protein
MPATTATSSPQNIGSTGSKFLDSILESLPVVGNVMRLMQGSESRVDPAGVAFASSGAAAQPSPNGSDSANSPSSPGLAPNPPAAPTSALNPVLALPQIPRNVAMPEVLPGLPAVHQIAPPLPSNSAPRAANPSSAHDSQPVLGNGPVTSTSPSQQSISDAPSNVAQKVGAAVQSALAASNSQSDADGSPSTGQQGTAANSDHAPTAPSAANLIAAAKNSDSIDSSAGASGANASSLTASSPEVSRTVVASESVTLKTASTPATEPSAAGANVGVFAQAISAAASQSTPSSPQTDGTEAAKSLVQPPISSPVPLPNPTNAAPTPTNTELRVQMQTDLLGSIDLRAAVHQSTLTATIGVQRDDVQTLLANELPALQHALTEKNLQVAQISVLNHSGGGSLDSRNAPHDPRREQPRSNPAFTMPYVQPIAQNLSDEIGISSSGYSLASAVSGRLSILV